MEIIDKKGEFVLTKDRRFAVNGWNSRRKNSWMLFFHPSLHVADMYTKDKKEQIGWMLGYPVTPDKREFCPGEIVFNMDFEYLTPESLEEELYRFGGRFAGVFLAGKFSRLYLDPTGSLSCVYSLNRPVIASTTALLDEASPMRDEKFMKTFDEARSKSGAWYPCGLTEFKNVRILLPNHFLDLQHWKVVRHWPKQEMKRIGETKDVRKAVEEIGALIKDTISIIAVKYPLHITLTAGMDSRMLLASSRGITDRILFITEGEDVNPLDYALSKNISKLFDLNHIVDSRFDPNRVILLGFGGETGRGLYWENDDKKADYLSVRDALEFLKYPAGNKDILEEIENWLSELRGFDLFSVKDLMFIEQRLGSFSGQLMYSYDKRGGRFALYPMNQRRMFELMLSLPVDYVKKSKLPEDICRIAWPELLYIPFNAPHFVGGLKYKKLLKKEFDSLKRNPMLRSAEKSQIIARMATRGRSVLKVLLSDTANVMRKMFKA